MGCGPARWRCMTFVFAHGGRFVLPLLLALALPAAAAAELDADPDALARAMSGHRIVVLGEVHDNGAQHALRLAALKALIATGARPAIAFEQFDRERQPDIDRARRLRPHDPDYLIAQAKGSPSWRWDYYRPFVALALEYDLPIVAANLSRADAMKVATGAVDASLPATLPPSFLHAHQEVIARGHCNLLPGESLPGMARAQIARDRSLAQAILPYAGRGVVLLAGNGHARIDIGVPYWLPAGDRSNSLSIGILERGGDDNGADEPATRFDAFALTERAARPDPCDELRKRMGK
jgi:uncharacterized iron-regulated protein